MSRIGKKPVQIPAGVTVTIDGTTVSAKGSKGELTRTFSELVSIALDGDVLTVSRVDESKESNAQQGLVRTLIHNMVVGVSEGFERSSSSRALAIVLRSRARTSTSPSATRTPSSSLAPRTSRSRCPTTPTLR